MTPHKIRKAFKEKVSFDQTKGSTEENDPDIYKHEQEHWVWFVIKYGRSGFTFVPYQDRKRGRDIHSVFGRDELHAYQQLQALVEGRPVNIYNFDRENF